MCEVFFSVIVPVYNAENYLHECIKSIVNQTYQNLELILVNDGSTDDSKKICESAKASDSRIKVVNKSNGGLISARKVGIENAQGEYCCFVDSDDWIELDMLECYIKILREKKVDIIASGFICEFPNHKTIRDNDLDEGVYNLDEQLISKLIYKDDLGRGAITPSVSNKTFRKELVHRNIISVNNAITNGEDGAILFPTLFDSSTLYVAKKCWYHYRIRDNSMSRDLAEDYYTKIYLLYQYLMTEFETRMCSELIKEGIRGYIEEMLQYGNYKKFNIKKKKCWMFPYEKVKKQSNVVIYGAGEVGLSYVKQIKMNNYCNIIAVVDQKYGEKSMIQSPESIKTLACDCIIIALSNKCHRDEIKQYIDSMGLNKEIEIIKSRPLRIV